MARRGPSVWRTIGIGIALMPFVCAAAFFGVVLAAEAMGLGALSRMEQSALNLLASAGILITPTPPPPTEAPPLTFEYGPLATIEQPAPAMPVPPTVTPFPSPTQTSAVTPSATITPSETTTETASPTSTVTLTATGSPTPSATTGYYPTAAASATRTATRTPTRTPTRTATPTRTPTSTGSPGAPPTLGSPTETSATTDPPTATSEGPPTTAAPTFTRTATSTTSACDAAANAGVEGQVAALINDERDDEDLYAYSVDSRLTAAARVHALDMACNHFTSHTGSDGSSVRDRVEAQGYDWSWIGENYYVGGGSAQSAVTWWMNSAPHTANILSPNYTQFGVGYVYDADSDYGGYFVVVFARPG